MAIERIAIGTSNPYLASPIKDEKSGSRLIGESLPQLLHDPSAGRMPRDIEMQHTSAIMAYNEKANLWVLSHSACGWQLHILLKS